MKFLDKLLIPAWLWVIFILVLVGTNLISVRSPFFVVSWILFALYLLVSAIYEFKAGIIFAISKISFSVIVLWLLSNGLFGTEGLILAESGDTIYRFLSPEGTFEEFGFEINFVKVNKESSAVVFEKNDIKKKAEVTERSSAEFSGFKLLQTGFNDGTGEFKIVKMFARPVVYFAYLVFSFGIAVFTFRLFANKDRKNVF